MSRDAPAVENPRTWATVASMGEEVGATAKTVWLIRFDDAEAETTVSCLTEKLRGSSVDERIGVSDLESGSEWSIHVSDIRYVRPVLDDETGEPVDPDEFDDLGDMWESMDLDALLETLDGPLCPGCEDERTYFSHGEPVYCGLCSEERITNGYRNPVGR